MKSVREIGATSKTSKVQQALVAQAIELEALANRLTHLRQGEQAVRVRKAALEAAGAVVALGGSSRWPELWQFLPELPMPRGPYIRRKIAEALGTGDALEDEPAP